MPPTGLNRREADRPPKLTLKLFVAGRSIRSESAIVQARRIAEVELGGNCDLAIVDVLEHPDIAERDRILATPALIREFPPPQRRVIGDLRDMARVMAGLGMRSRTQESKDGQHQRNSDTETADRNSRA